MQKACVLLKNSEAGSTSKQKWLRSLMLEGSFTCLYFVDFSCCNIILEIMI